MHKSIDTSFWNKICECLRYFHSEAIVRASCRLEATEASSNAEKFLSLLNICLEEPETLREAADRVWRSCGTDNLNEEVLIQLMMADVVRSGVVFTADMETLAPYYTVNYEDGSDTEAVTSGATNAVRMFI